MLHSKATQRLAEISLRRALLFWRQCSSCLCEICAGSLYERLDVRDDFSRRLTLQGLGFEGLHDEGEDLAGL